MSTVDNHHQLQTMGKCLGYLGLLPFVTGAATALLFEELPAVVLRGFTLYSLAILSFMGGVHWGLALIMGTYQSKRLFISITPVAVAWICVMLLPGYLAVTILGLAFIAQWTVDRPILAELSIPSWYLEMRPRLAYVVAGCHLFILFRLLD